MAAKDSAKKAEKAQPGAKDASQKPKREKKVFDMPGQTKELDPAAVSTRVPTRVRTGSLRACRATVPTRGNRAERLTLVHV